MANPEPLNLGDLWDWFEKKFGKDAMNRYYGYETGELIKEFKRRIKVACEFYLEWCNDPKLFINWYEDKKKVDELLRFLEHHFGDEWYDDYDNEPYVKEKIVLKYNEWLFKLAFKDVLGDNDD